MLSHPWFTEVLVADRHAALVAARRPTATATARVPLGPRLHPGLGRRAALALASAASGLRLRPGREAPVACATC